LTRGTARGASGAHVSRWRVRRRPAPTAAGLARSAAVRPWARVRLVRWGGLRYARRCVSPVSRLLPLRRDARVPRRPHVAHVLAGGGGRAGGGTSGRPVGADAD